MAWLAIDAGTSAIKASVFDGAGRQIAGGREETGVSRGGEDFAEQDMTEVWQAVVVAARAALRACPAESIEGIVSTAQGDGAWLVDTAGEPAGPAILWNDGRARKEMERIRSRGIVERAFRISGSVPYPGLPCAILPWLAERDRARLNRARWLLSANGWLHYRLTGQIHADLSDASNPFSDVKARRYSSALLDLYGLAEYGKLLPPIHSGFAPVSQLHAVAAAEIGLAGRAIPVVMAPYDIVSTAAGCESTAPGEGCLILGTTVCAEAIVADPDLSREPSGTTIALSDGNFLRAMPTLTGCEALDWAAALLELEDLSELSDLATGSPAGARNLVFFPYLSPAGERSPFLAPDACGSFHGLSVVHRRQDLARSVFEGLSFAIRECVAEASPTPLSSLAVCGGGARSDFWCQLIADTCRCTVFRPGASEIGALGAYRYALVATGAEPSLKSAAPGASAEGRRFDPSDTEVAGYARRFARFLELRKIVAPSWSVLRDFSVTASPGRVS